MPRISAPTVAEHRVRQRAAILRAAEEVALERGGAGVSISAVAARTGLARPSVYAYFPSAEDLLVTLVLEAFDRWRTALHDATRDAPDAEAVVRAYVAAAARSAAEGNHRLAAALSGVPLPDAVVRTVAEQHREAAAPLAAAVATLLSPTSRSLAPRSLASRSLASRSLASEELGALAGVSSDARDGGGEVAEVDGELERWMALMTSVVSHCVRRVEAGHDPEREAAAAADFALGGLVGTQRA